MDLNDDAASPQGAAAGPSGLSAGQQASGASEPEEAAPEGAAPSDLAGMAGLDSLPHEEAAKLLVAEAIAGRLDDAGMRKLVEYVQLGCCTAESITRSTLDMGGDAGGVLAAWESFNPQQRTLVFKSPITGFASHLHNMEEHGPVSVGPAVLGELTQAQLLRMLAERGFEPHVQRHSDSGDQGRSPSSDRNLPRPKGAEIREFPGPCATDRLERLWEICAWFTHVKTVTATYSFAGPTLMRLVTAKLTGDAADWYSPYVASGGDLPFATLAALQAAMTATWVGKDPYDLLNNDLYRRVLTSFNSWAEFRAWFVRTAAGLREYYPAGRDWTEVPLVD